MLWSQRPRLIAYCLLVELAVISITVAAGGRPAQSHDLVVFACLASLGVIQAELSRQTERVRRRINTTPHINMLSAWTFAGVLLLPVRLIPLLVAVLYAHLAVRSWYRMRRVPPFRTVFNAALASLTSLAARGVLVLCGFHGLPAAAHGFAAGFAPIALAGLAHLVVGALIAVPGLTIEQRTWSALFGTRTENTLEAVTIGLGAVNAVLLVTVPGLLLLMVPCVLLLQRGVLVEQLEIAATTDEKTGVFNTAGWRHIASQEMTRAARRPQEHIGVLMIDLDRFKRINDSYGHVAGDHVLREVAATITGEVRGYDTVGRFGGEEFVVLVPGSTTHAVAAIAERIRHAVTTIAVPVPGAAPGEVISGLSVSIGVAVYPAASVAVERLVQEADAALYRAKNLGRNRVALATAA